MCQVIVEMLLALVTPNCEPTFRAGRVGAGSVECRIISYRMLAAKAEAR